MYTKRLWLMCLNLIVPKKDNSNIVVYSLFNSVNSPIRSNLLRPLTTHDPEGMWNLLSIVRELFRHRDPNAVELLQLLTQECLSLEQIVVWWFNSRSQGSGRQEQSYKKNKDDYKSNINTASTEMTKHACASFCDELVVLWRLACLDPMLSCGEKRKLREQLEQWQCKTIEKAKNGKNNFPYHPESPLILNPLSSWIPSGLLLSYVQVIPNTSHFYPILSHYSLVS